jgi:hypothetical protein
MECAVQQMFVRGGPLDILGGGGADPKKFMHGVQLEKNSCKHLGKEKKFVQLHEKSK